MTVEIVGLAVAVLVLLFGDGLIRALGNLVMRKYEWEPKPSVDASGAFKAGVSHDYERKRTLTHAAVVAPQPWLRRALFRLNGKRLPRWLDVDTLLEKAEDLDPGRPREFTGRLPETASLPTWNPFGPRQQRKTADVRLWFLVQAGRRRAMSRRLKRLRHGVFDPASLEKTRPAAELAGPDPAVTPPSS